MNREPGWCEKVVKTESMALFLLFSSSSFPRELPLSMKWDYFRIGRGRYRVIDLPNCSDDDKYVRLGFNGSNKSDKLSAVDVLRD